MARGNIVTIASVRRMFGLIVLVAQSGNFKNYERIYLSKTGTVIGAWRNVINPLRPYRDYLRKIPVGSKLISINEKYIVFKSIYKKKTKNGSKCQTESRIELHT